MDDDTELEDYTAGRLLETPTFEAYEPLQEAFFIFDQKLFDNELPECMITLHRKDKRSRGYYGPQRFSRTDGNHRTIDLIAMNPLYFTGEHGGTREVLQTLLHEMCHHWQQHFGKPSRGRYHNHEWAAKMKAVGLQPSNTGKPGGKEVGQQMSDYPIEGGPFIGLATTMMEAGFFVPWAERRQPEVQKPPSRVTYHCTACGMNLLGKRGYKAGGCCCTGEFLPYEEVTEATAKPACIDQNSVQTHVTELSSVTSHAACRTRLQPA